jgi:hypothetical protein
MRVESIHTISPLTTYHTGPHTILLLLRGRRSQKSALAAIILYCSERIQISDRHGCLQQQHQANTVQATPVHPHTLSPSPHRLTHPGHLPATSVFPGHSASLATGNMTQLPATTKQKTLHAPTTRAQDPKKLVLVIHTHPCPTACLGKQYLSGLLAGDSTCTHNPASNPTNWLTADCTSRLRVSGSL